MSAHTPGPWHWEADAVKCDPYGRVRYQVTATGKTVARLYYSSYEGGPTNADADARLIAAAPDLLAVAQFFLRGIEGGHIKCAGYIDFDPNAEKLEIKSPATRLREAIAKATGAA